MQKTNKNIRRLAVIPARSGSKRIHKKNIKKFHGKPIICYSLEALQNSNLFDVIHVSTDDAETQEIVGRLGDFIQFSRPLELSDDYTGLMPVLKYVVEEFSKMNSFFDEVWLVSACAPMIEINDYIKIEKAYRENTSHEALTVISEMPVSAFWSLTVADDGGVCPLFPEKLDIRSQDLDPSYVDSGTVAIFTSEVIKNCDGTVPINLFQGYVMPRMKLVDIDTPEDWLLASAMFQIKNNSDEL